MRGEANKNKKRLFEDDEIKAEKMDVFIDELSEVRSREDVKNIVKFLYGCEKDYSSYVDLKNGINLLASEYEQFYKKEIIDYITSIDIVKSFKELKDGTYIIETSEGPIRFKTASSLYDKLNKKPDDDTEKYFLYIKKRDIRLGRCHWLSVKGSKVLNKYFNLKNQVVTGYAYFNTEKSQYLHSWIEFEKNGKEYALDSTMNAIMNKEGYYLLEHIKEEEIISKIDGKTIEKDMELYYKILPFRPENYFYFSDEEERQDIHTAIDIKTYLTSRDELIKDLEKNFNKTNEGEER